MIQLNPNFIGKISLNKYHNGKESMELKKRKIKLPAKFHLKLNRHNIRKKEKFNVIKQLKNKNEVRKKRIKELEKRFDGKIKSALDRFKRVKII